ncbi:hypothetical protein, partial [uncultured Eubacterium sp.]|uniref:hypothetical protein n=1 Tax=uncultured Eubacterium sp. TaxID=165185 RepID=UPI002599E956
PFQLSAGYRSEIQTDSESQGDDMSRDKTTTSGIPLTSKKIKLLFNRFERLNVITSIQAEFGHERSPKNKILPWDTSQ